MVLSATEAERLAAAAERKRSWLRINVTASAVGGFTTEAALCARAYVCVSVMLASRAHVNLYACRNSHGKQSAKSIDLSWYHRSIVSVLERAASVQQMREYQDRRTDGVKRTNGTHRHGGVSG